MKKHLKERPEKTEDEGKDSRVEESVIPGDVVATDAELAKKVAGDPTDRAVALERDLTSIYTDKEGRLPDFTKIDGKPTSRIKSFFAGLVLFLVVLGGVIWGGLWYFGRSGGGFTGDGVTLSFKTEDSLTTGMTTEVAVRYRNNESIPLASSILSIDMPEGFVLLEAQPEPDENGEWPLGSISSGTEGEVLLKGWARSSPEDALTFRSTLTYNPADFSSAFERVGSHTVIVDDSALEVMAAGPEKLTPGDEVEFTYTYSSTSTMALDDLAFRFEPADNFVLASSDPAPDDIGGLLWSLSTIEPGASGTVTVRGTFSSEARGPKRMDGTLGFKVDDHFIAVAQGSAETEVLKSALSLGVIVNGSTSDTDASFGELLNFSITYANEGDVDLKNIEVSANLPSHPGTLLDWVALDDKHEGTRKGSVITWSPSEIEALTILKPGEKGTIDFSVPLTKNPLSDSDVRLYGVDAFVSAKIGRVGTIARDREVASAPLAINLNSDTVFKSYGRYFMEDGTPLGAGPLPPRVGQATTYRVFWVIENSLHELTNLSIETILPQGARWAGTDRLVEAGALSFDETGRRATWRLNRLPTSVERVTVMFDVEYTPAFEDVGRIVDITNDTRFEALDKETDSVILLMERPIDTSLPADDEAAGKGVVQE